MKKRITTALLALGLSLGGVGSLSAASNPTDSNDVQRPAAVCINEDCPNFGKATPLRIGARGGQRQAGQGQGMQSGQRQAGQGQGLALQDGSGRKEWAQGGAGVQNRGQVQQRLENEECPNPECPNPECPNPECLNDGVKPMDGTGQKNGQKRR